MGLVAGVVALIIGAAILLEFEFDHMKGVAIALVVIAIAFLYENGRGLFNR